MIALVVATCVAAPCLRSSCTAEFFLPGECREQHAVLGSSAVFAAMHLQLIQFPGLFLFGTLAAVLAVKRGLVASIASSRRIQPHPLLLLGLIN